MGQTFRLLTVSVISDSLNSLWYCSYEKHGTHFFQFLANRILVYILFWETHIQDFEGGREVAAIFTVAGRTEGLGRHAILQGNICW